MDSEEESAIAAIIIAVVSRKKHKNRKNKSDWVKPWLRRRERLGIYNTLMQELHVEESEVYQKFLRLSPEMFDELLVLVEPYIQRKTTVLHEPIPAKIKLAATLKYLSTGMNYSDLQHLFRIHKSTLSQFIPNVCEAIYSQLRDKYLKVI